MSLLGPQDLGKLEEMIGVTFKDRGLLLDSISHPSSPNASIEHFRCLTHLGDRILLFVISEDTYHVYLNERRTIGDKRRSMDHIVSNKHLVHIARKSGIASFLKGKNTGKPVADCVEALIAAIYLDAGMEKARQFIRKFICKEIKIEDRQKGEISFEKKRKEKDPRILLEQRSMSLFGGCPFYGIANRIETSEDSLFVVAVFLKGKEFGRGTSADLQKAEKLAAKSALRKLETQ